MARTDAVTVKSGNESAWDNVFGVDHQQMYFENRAEADRWMDGKTRDWKSAHKYPTSPWNGHNAPEFVVLEGVGKLVPRQRLLGNHPRR